MEYSQNEQYTRNEIDDFYHSCCPFGSLYVREAIKTFIKVDLNSSDLYEECERFCDETDTKFKDLDVCWIAYSHNLQMARNEIYRLINFDIQNDANIEVYGNFCSTSLDYSEEDIQELKEQLKNTEQNELKQLMSNEFFNWFIEEIDLIGFVKALEKI